MIRLLAVVGLLLWAPISQATASTPRLSYPEARHAFDLTTTWPVRGCHRESRVRFRCREFIRPTAYEADGSRVEGLVIEPYTCVSGVVLRGSDVAVALRGCS